MTADGFPAEITDDEPEVELRDKAAGKPASDPIEKLMILIHIFFLNFVIMKPTRTIRLRSACLSGGEKLTGFMNGLPQLVASFGQLNQAEAGSP